MKKIFAAVAATALCAGAQAAVIGYNNGNLNGYSFTTASATTDFGTNPIKGNTGVAPLTGSLKLFDSSLGTLTGVTLTLTGFAESDLLVTNTGSSTATGLASAKIRLYFTSSLAQLNTAIGGNAAEITLEPTTPFTLAANSSQTYLDLTDSASLSVNTTNFVSAFSKLGGGNFNISCSSYTSTVMEYTGGNAAANQSTTGDCGAQVTYTYTAAATPSNPTPEPASLALVGLGLAGVGAVRKKTKKA